MKYLYGREPTEFVTLLAAKRDILNYFKSFVGIESSGKDMGENVRKNGAQLLNLLELGDKSVSISCNTGQKSCKPLLFFILFSFNIIHI